MIMEWRGRVVIITTGADHVVERSSNPFLELVSVVVKIVDMLDGLSGNGRL